MSSRLFGVLLLLLAALRLAASVRIYRHMRSAQQRNNDIELWDWLTGIAFPVLCHLLLGSTGVAFLERYALAFDGLAIVSLAMLLLGVFGAWELLVWMAIARSRTK
jgi:hypothetical protein